MKIKNLSIVLIFICFLVLSFSHSYTSDPFSITKIKFYPQSPKLLKIDQKVQVSFSYYSSHNDGVNIWINPLSNGEPTPNSGTSPSKVYSPGKGKVKRYFTVQSERARVDEIRFQITPEDDKTKILFEKVVAVKYTFR